MKKTRKKGSIILLSLAVMICLIVLAGVFINIAANYEVANRAMFATEEVARVRAQAVDIRLKEQEGLVEIFHAPYSADVAQYDVDHANIQQKDGHLPLFSPTDPEYQAQVQNADTIAIQSGIDVLDASLFKNVDGDLLVDPKPENFCIDVEPLPPSSILESDTDQTDINFSCDATINGETKTLSADETVSKLQLEQYEKSEIKNAVFVGSVTQYNHFIFNALKSFGLQVNPYYEFWEVALPQVDVCTRAATAAQNNGVDCTSSTQDLGNLN